MLFGIQGVPSFHPTRWNKKKERARKREKKKERKELKEAATTYGKEEVNRERYSFHPLL